MNVAQIIADKRDGKPLEDDQIDFLIKGYADESVPDYQMSAFAMAVFFQGMTLEETTVFTRCMLESGDQMKWSNSMPSVDKHSTVRWISSSRSPDIAPSYPMTSFVVSSIWPAARLRVLRQNWRQPTNVSTPYAT